MDVSEHPWTGSDGTVDDARITVGIGEFAVSADGDILCTNGLGSCVAVALVDRTAGVAGLAHVMLPQPAREVEAEAKYVDTGIAALVRTLAQTGVDVKDLTAKIVGGSDMLEFSSVEDHVGSQNVAAVRGALDDHGIPILAADVGGGHGRSVEVDPRTGDVTVTTATSGEQRL